MRLPIRRIPLWPVAGPTPTCSRSRSGIPRAFWELRFPLVFGSPAEVAPLSLVGVTTPVATRFVVLLFAAAVWWYA